ncbi:MAG: helix-turn-helix transcriptional regulator [Eubacteriales bacterium]
MRRIKELRLAKGVRQVDMAAYFHVSQPTIVSWEADGTYPPCRLMPDIAIYLGCTLDDLYKGEKEAI